MALASFTRRVVVPKSAPPVLKPTLLVEEACSQRHTMVTCPPTSITGGVHVTRAVGSGGGTGGLGRHCHTGQ